MPPISLKKIFIVILVVILLSQIKPIIEFILIACRMLVVFVLAVFRVFWVCFTPLRNSPIEGQYVVALLFLALVWITIYKLFRRR